MYSPKNLKTNHNTGFLKLQYLTNNIRDKVFWTSIKSTNLVNIQVGMVKHAQTNGK